MPPEGSDLIFDHRHNAGIETFGPIFGEFTPGGIAGDSVGNGSAASPIGDVAGPGWQRTVSARRAEAMAPG